VEEVGRISGRVTLLWAESTGTSACSLGVPLWRPCGRRWSSSCRMTAPTGGAALHPSKCGGGEGGGQNSRSRESRRTRPDALRPDPRAVWPVSRDTGRTQMRCADAGRRRELPRSQPNARERRAWRRRRTQADLEETVWVLV